jgi:hypothetical protein
MSACASLRGIAAIAILQATTFVTSPTFASLVIGAVDTPVTQSFNGLTTSSSLPSLNSGGWRTWTSFAAPTFAGGIVSPTLTLQTTTLSVFSPSGTYSFRDGATSDRALGFIFSTDVPRHIMVEIKNNTSVVLASLTASWNLEKYRNGPSPMTVSFYHSSDGVNWLSGAGSLSYSGIDNFDGTSSPVSTPQNATLSGLNIASGALHYLRWEFLRTGGTDQTQVVGVDDFSITGATHLPEASSWVAATIFAGTALLTARFHRRSPVSGDSSSGSA